MKKSLSLFLSVLMIFSAVSTAAFTSFAANSGSSVSSVGNNPISEGAVEKVYGDETLAFNLPFNDVPTGSWYFESVNYVYNEGIVYGTSDVTFSPSTVLTRAMCVTLLARTSGEDISEYENIFGDVTTGSWYEKSVSWAAAKNIVTGIGGGLFAPNSPITREQLATIMYRYADYQNINTKDKADISSFSDASKISSWALDAVKWSVAAGLISGTGKGLEPGAGSTRSQMATILYRFIQKFVMEYAGEIEVSGAFSDQMIIQRGEKITVWGNITENELNTNGNNEGKIVKADLGGKAVGFGKVDSQGYFKIVLDRMLPASTDPVALTVTSGVSKIVFNDILIGDVYMIIGQSNVFYSTNNYLVTFPEKVKEQAWNQYFVNMERFDNVRLFRNSSEDYKYYQDKVAFGGETLAANGFAGQTGNECVIQERGWQKPRDKAKDYDEVYYNYRDTHVPPGSAAEIFSALGYYTACELYQNTGVPTGMIELDASGYSIAAFMPNELIEGYDHLGTTAHGYENVYVDDATAMGSRFAYNQQIHPVRNFSIAGLIWYQGESDAYNVETVKGPEEYTFADRLTDLVNYFKANFGNDDFKTYIMEYPMCCDLQAVFFLDFGLSRAELNKVKNNIENSYICSASDLNTEENNAFDSPHTYCKPAMAKRLSSMITSSIYGKESYYASSFGPIATNFTYGENDVTITFENVGDSLGFEGGKYKGGIFLLYDGEYNGGVNRLGMTHSFYPLNFVEIKDASKVEIINKKQIKVTGSEKVYGVAYNFITERYYPGYVNLRNSNGVPASAFVDTTPYYTDTENYTHLAIFRQIKTAMENITPGGNVGDYENMIARVSFYIGEHNANPDAIPKFDKTEADAITKEYINDFVDALIENEIISDEEYEKLYRLWSCPAQTDEDFENYLTENERTLPGCIPSVLVDIAKKIEALEAGNKSITENELDKDVEKLCKYLKTYIDDFGGEMSQEEVENIRQKYMLGLSSAYFKGSSQKILTAKEEFNNRWRAEFYKISVYEGVQDWDGKDDGWSPEIHYPPSDDDDDDDEGGN